MKSMSYWKGYGEAVGASVEVGHPPYGKAAMKLCYFRSGWSRGAFKKGSVTEACFVPSPPSASRRHFPLLGVGDGIIHMADAQPPF